MKDHCVLLVKSFELLPQHFQLTEELLDLGTARVLSSDQAVALLGLNIKHGVRIHECD